MNLLTCLLLIVCGALAASALIIAKQPNAKATIDKLVPIQGWLGVVLCVLGIWSLISLLIHINIMVHILDYFIFFLISSLIEIGLGFLLGYGLINQYALSKNPEAAAKGAVMEAKLTAYRIPLGIAGIVVGVIFLIEIIRYKAW